VLSKDNQRYEAISNKNEIISNERNRIHLTTNNIVSPLVIIKIEIG
jgi:hypothetical protein